ncbi:MAG: hypothetical protein ACRDS9_10055 [Pseudonocardiaceae bacterium]
MNKPRSAGELGDEFPYFLPTICYIEVSSDGTVSWGTEPETYERVEFGESRLYAVWPGKWSSHLFAIDDLDQFARALGLVHDPKRTGLADHEHQVRWEISPYEKNPDGSYITINVWLDCGCRILDIRSFASHMQTQRGWDIATTSGWGGGDDTQYVRVRRKSLAR